MLVGGILSPLVFCCRHFSAADCKLISCRAAWLGVLVLDFFSCWSNPIWKLFKKKRSSFAPPFFVAQIAHSEAIHTMETPQFQMSNVYTPPHQPQPPSPNPTPKHFTHQPPRFFTHPRFGSAISTKPKPKVSATRRKLSSRGGKEVYCVIHQVVLGGCCCRFFFRREKKGEKPPGRTKGV